MFAGHLQIVETSIAKARELRSLDELAAQMFVFFFAQHPEAKACFEGFELEKVGPFKFCKISDAFVDVLKFPDYSKTSVSEEVYRHQIYDIQDKEYYFALAEAFVETVKSALGTRWSVSHEECWSDTLSGLKHNISLAAKEHLA